MLLVPTSQVTGVATTIIDIASGTDTYDCSAVLNRGSGTHTINAANSTFQGMQF
jgi:hypothetical protein